MNFRVDPVVVVNTLKSMLEQKDSRMTTIQAVYELAAKGLVLPGKTDKEQVQLLNSIISLCEPSFLNVRPGKGGGVGLPSMQKSATVKPGRRSRATAKGILTETGEASSTENSTDFLKTGT